MSTDTIIIDNYKFELYLLSNQINIKLTDMILHEKYEGTVNKDNIYVKSIQKFYSMIIKSLNKESNYKFTINSKKTTIICTISYSNDVIDIDEDIIFTKLDNQITKEILLLDIIKELEERIKELEDQQNNLIFAYRILSTDTISFNINSNELDFTKYNHDDIYKMGYFYINCIDVINYNKFKKVKKIITNQNTYIMSDKKFKIQHNSALYLPSVIEIIICIIDTKFQSEKSSLREECYINPHTFPNLERIYYINDGYIKSNDTDIASIHPISYHQTGFFKKLNFVSYKNFANHNMIDTSLLSELKLYAIANNINLEIT